jgi:hypothetical protein
MSVGECKLNTLVVGGYKKIMTTLCIPCLSLQHMLCRFPLQWPKAKAQRCDHDGSLRGPSAVEKCIPCFQFQLRYMLPCVIGLTLCTSLSLYKPGLSPIAASSRLITINVSLSFIHVTHITAVLIDPCALFSDRRQLPANQLVDQLALKL